MFFTRTIYQAHMEVHRIITKTEPIVINRVHPKASKNPVFSMPFIVFQTYKHFICGDGKRPAADICFLLKRI